MRSLMLAWLLANLLLPQASVAPQTVQPLPQPPAPVVSEFNWKTALMTGDDQLQVFDNARKALRGAFLQLGVLPGNIKELSMSPAEQQSGTLPSTANNLLAALQALAVKDGDACLLHMTSHGTRQGFFMRAAPVMTPDRLNTIVEQGCGSQPTVLLISACYSGVFARGAMLKPNRIILTAAREDLTSFGCAPENQYTYWDGCLVENLPKADNWKSLYGSIQRCVEAKESRGQFMPSLPQAYFGDQVADLKIPALVMASLGGSVTSRCPVSDDDTYGFSAANAIKVGLDGISGPAREMQYLNALRGPAGQRVEFRRVGSTMTADKTILDIYELRYEGLQQPIRVYLDEYHFEEPRAVKGLVCAMEIGLGGI